MARDGGGGSSASMLPRPVLDASQNTAPRTSALQRSLLAKAFLPQDAAVSYNETVAMMERLSETRLARIRARLISLPGGSSNSGSIGSTPPATRPIATRLTQSVGGGA